MLKLSSLVFRRLFNSSSILSNNKKNYLRLREPLINMPKEEAHLRDIKKMRMEKRSKRFLVQPNSVNWQVKSSEIRKNLKFTTLSGAG